MVTPYVKLYYIVNDKDYYDKQICDTNTINIMSLLQLLLNTSHIELMLNDNM